ncbi:acylphosphatase [Pseudooceanicola onchidii]|uniref:acylphosphatase n=1 Tax=Pseudooceanicola onchidii TaxID=2562279 RepID=UPI0010AAB80F|nr:acylphosphatase [Pseudooceanicola onchidii]
MSDITRELRITGRVQGVAYRAWTRSRAEALGLTGFVQNESDGSVTAVVHGPKDRVEALITECHSGPGAAAVRDVRVTDASAPDLATFEIRRG